MGPGRAYNARSIAAIRRWNAGKYRVRGKFAGIRLHHGVERSDCLDPVAAAKFRLGTRQKKETGMEEQETRADLSDRKRININEPSEMQAWATKFGVTMSQLKTAIVQVGTYAAAVERKLKTNVQAQV
jgi:uncharacterized protein DUF3606